ncbi:hypothetical protein [Tessaracoccus sp. MC1756]|uniref:hypothetical protein n=1 Tax=Tessaracoccus sp. MC1756 TaxID=2760311 RepID=UPI0016037390|nr:hypothetical protein [Tessaracoccus sp. MC1756]MBB1509883.1 hypothetical protein [Tessaracoccus sp. MC1756]
MGFIRRVALTAVAAATAMTGFTASPAHAAPVYDTNGPVVTVYNTPGNQRVNGRLWSTACAKYSSTVVRCTTNLWSTIVVHQGTQYINETGWHFNNLTYLPSHRAAWAGNPLATTGQFVSAGRPWRTECDTAATGHGACRSYIWTRYVSTEGGSPWLRQGWVFNNQVLFATPTVPPVTAVPPIVLDRAVLTPTGFGPLQADISDFDAKTLGFKVDKSYVREDGSTCSTVETPDSFVNRYGVWSSPVMDQLIVRSPQVKITDGAGGVSTFRLGQTVDQLKAAYGAALTEENSLFYLREGDSWLSFSANTFDESGDPAVVDLITAGEKWYGGYGWCE